MIFEYFKNITFGQPEAFYLFAIIPLMLLWMLIKKNRQSSMYASTVASISNLSTWKNAFRNLPVVLRILALSCIIVALARPQVKNTEQQTEGQGIDIVLAIDVSGSMTAQDLTPNRLEAAKAMAAEFIDNRVADRIGIVIFSGESFTQCPLTTDKDVLKAQIEQIRIGLLEDGTAIGSGLATSVDRLRNSSSKSKVVILLTDGVNNSGLIDPGTAKEIAKAFNVKVYTIGVGTDGYAPTPENTPSGVVMRYGKVTINEKLMQAIASETGGKYFRAKDNESLKNIYSDINRLERSKVQVTTYHRYQEKFYPFIMAALALILLEVLLRFTVFKKFP